MSIGTKPKSAHCNHEPDRMVLPAVGHLQADGDVSK
jgi:hypothetical protein